MRKKMTVVPLAFLTSLLLCGPASAADGSNPESRPGPPAVDPYITSGKAARDFRIARNRWLARAIPDYRMTAQRVCFCAPPFRAGIRVRNGRPVRISGRPWFGPWSVPGMFRIVALAIKREATRLEVRYHPKLGFPRRATIDYIAMVADDEMYYRINRFRVLRRPGGPQILRAGS